MASTLFARKSVSELHEEAEGQVLKRALGPWNLIALGIGAIIGAGLFVGNEVGAASCTGLGELVLRTLGSFLVVEEMRRGASPRR